MALCTSLNLVLALSDQLEDMTGVVLDVKDLSWTVMLLMALGLRLVWSDDLKSGELVRVVRKSNLMVLSPELMEQPSAVIRQRLVAAAGEFMFPDDQCKSEIWPQKWSAVG